MEGLLDPKSFMLQFKPLTDDIIVKDQFQEGFSSCYSERTINTPYIILVSNYWSCNIGEAHHCLEEDCVTYHKNIVFKTLSGIFPIKNHCKYFNKQKRCLKQQQSRCFVCLQQKFHAATSSNQHGFYNGAGKCHLGRPSHLLT